MKLVYVYSEIVIKGGTDKVIVDKANYFANKYLKEVLYGITEDRMVYPK